MKSEITISVDKNCFYLAFQFSFTIIQKIKSGGFFMTVIIDLANRIGHHSHDLKVLLQEHF